jgi:hypothetical protein
LFTIPAGQLSSHEGIPHETQEEKDQNKNENCPGKLHYQEEYSRENRDYNPQEIRDNIFPGDLHPAESLRAALPEQQGAQAAFAKSTGFAVIVTIHAMSAQQPELKKKNIEYVTNEPEETELVQDKCADSPDQERQKI